MTQLDDIQKTLTKITAQLDTLVKAQSTTALADAMTKAVAQTNAIRESQAKVSTEPEVSGPGVTQQYVDTPLAVTDKVSDPFGGIPPARVADANPDTPLDHIGLPQWESGREPREVLQEHAVDKPNIEASKIVDRLMRKARK